MDSAALTDPLVAEMADRLVIVYRPIDELIPYARNARTHSPEQIELLKRLMLQFGWTNPVLLDGADGMLAGHGRIVAARALWAAGRAIRRCPMGQAPTIDLSGFSEAEKRAYVLADNQSALRAGWDIEMVGLELGELKSSGFDMSLTGFSTSELSRFTSGAGHGDPEVAPDPPAVHGYPRARPAPPMPPIRRNAELSPHATELNSRCALWPGCTCAWNQPCINLPPAPAAS